MGLMEQSENWQMLEQRNEALTKCLREVDYMISYGMIREARELIKETVGEPDVI